LLSDRGVAVLCDVNALDAAGVIISHFGSGGLEGAEDNGERSINVEPSQPEPMRGE
jgi:hypothetical protein